MGFRDAFRYVLVGPDSTTTHGADTRVPVVCGLTISLLPAWLPAACLWNKRVQVGSDASDAAVATDTVSEASGATAAGGQAPWTLVTGSPSAPTPAAAAASTPAGEDVSKAGLASAPAKQEGPGQQHTAPEPAAAVTATSSSPAAAAAKPAAAAAEDDDDDWGDDADDAVAAVAGRKAGAGGAATAAAGEGDDDWGNWE